MVATGQSHHGVGEFVGEGGPVGRRPEPHVGIERQHLHLALVGVHPVPADVVVGPPPRENQ